MRYLLLLCCLGCYDFSLLDKLVIAREAYQVEAPPGAREYWAELEKCSGLKGDFDSVRWFVEPNGLKINGEWKEGAWLSDWNIIISPPQTQNDWFMIKHEEMHALLKGGPRHPVKYFNGLCGNLMSPYHK